MANNLPSQRVYHVPELLGLVLDGLGENELGSMTRVSKSAHTASIQRLWKSIRDLKHLIQVYPSGLLAAKGDQIRLEPVFPLQELDWTRFKHYSIHITKLVLTTLPFSTAFYSNFINVSNELFPHLQEFSLQWPSTASFPNSEFLALVGKALEVLTIHASIDSLPLNTSNIFALNTLLQQLPLRAPSLRELTLPRVVLGGTDVEKAKPLAASFCFILPSLINLKKIGWRWEAMPSCMVSSILHHPNISNIQLQAVQPLPETNREYFPSFTHLCLKGSTDVALGSWLGGLPRPDLLERAELELGADSRTGEKPIAPRFVTPLSQAANLTAIHIHLLGKRPTSWSSFEPLLGCKRIRSFVLTTESSLADFNGGALNKLADSWRALEDIQVSSLSGLPAVILSDLKPLGSCCASLRKVILDILLCDEPEASTSGVLSTRDPISNYSNGLTRLELIFCQAGAQVRGQYKLEDHVNPRRIAQAIRGIWPSVKPDSMLLTAWHEDETRRAALGEHLRYIREFVTEMDLRDREVRRHADIKHLLEKENQRLTEAKNLLAEERDALARKVIHLERIKPQAEIKKEE